VSEAGKILAELRWAADRIVIEPFGERVWLKNREGGGITDCCLADDPCEYHAKLTHEAPSQRS
jgi:hypothetical protein